MSKVEVLIIDLTSGETVSVCDKLPDEMGWEGQSRMLSVSEEWCRLRFLFIDV